MLSEFADFELADESVYNTREDRMRSAFEKSKQSYAEEQVYTESGVRFLNIGAYLTVCLMSTGYSGMTHQKFRLLQNFMSEI